MPPPTAPNGRDSKLVVALAALIVGVLIGGGVGWAIGHAGRSSEKAVQASVAATDSTTSTVRATTTTVSHYVPVPADFNIEIIETSRQCFGTAGCSIQYTINPTYVGPRPPDPSKTFTVIYDVQGGESPKTANFTIKGSKASFQQGDYISTPPNPTLSATATRILAQ
jgi:hypothetical protein